MKLKIMDLGTLSHEKAHDIQYEVLKGVQEGDDDTLILVEHPKVITLGRNAKAENILFTEEYITSMGYDFRRIERGGDVTYHGPGQIVGYTLFNLKKNHGGSIRVFVEMLEQSFIDYLSEFHGIEARRDEINSGVFVGDSKITAVGLSVKRGVTMHGFAFNVNTDLQDYSVIVPCGLADRGVTSLEKELGRKLDIEEVKRDLAGVIARTYKFDGTEML
jgi:lipoyl(octanoyl) transferase